MTEFTQAQLQVIETLMGCDKDFKVIEERPSFPATLSSELRAELERELSPVADSLALDLQDRRVVAAKFDFSMINNCEGLFFAMKQERDFEWTTNVVVGKVFHAVIASRMAGAEGSPLELVGQAVAKILRDQDDYGPWEFLDGLSAFELGELKAAAADLVTKMEVSWPPIQPRWYPRIESSLAVSLCGGRIELRGKPDLLLGKPGQIPSRVLITDLKTGNDNYDHPQELRYYALLETLRNGSPPYRIASYYLRSGRPQFENVTPETLRSAVRFVIEGVRKIAEVQTFTRGPVLTPGRGCRFCPSLNTCEPGREFEAARAQQADAFG